MFGNQIAILGKNESGGILVKLHGLRNVFVLSDVEGKIEMIATCVGAHSSRGIQPGDDEEFYLWVVLIVVIQPLHNGHLGYALHTPGSPQIKKHDLPFVGSQMLLITIESAIDQVAGDFWATLQMGRLHVCRDLPWNEFEKEQTCTAGQRYQRNKANSNTLQHFSQVPLCYPPLLTPSANPPLLARYLVLRQRGLDRSRNSSLSVDSPG